MYDERIFGRIRRYGDHLYRGHGDRHCPDQLVEHDHSTIGGIVMKEMLEEYGGVAVCVIMGLVILGIFISMFKGNGSLASDVWKVLMSPML